MLARMSGLQRAIVHAANTKSGGGFLFSGHHSNKDLLIISDFTTKGLPQELNPSPHAASRGPKLRARREAAWTNFAKSLLSKRDLLGEPRLVPVRSRGTTGELTCQRVRVFRLAGDVDVTTHTLREDEYELSNKLL